MGQNGSKGKAPLLGEIFPDFTIDSSKGEIKWHEYINGSWAILFSHPADYTPVCTTELGTVEAYFDRFTSRGVKIAALSCDDVASHKGWIKDILRNEKDKTDLSYPILADNKRELAVGLGMLDPNCVNDAGIPLTARAVYIIGPDKKLKLSLLYPATTGRNFDEIIRVIDSLQLTANNKVATPANWKSGESCMVLPGLTDEDANKLFKNGFTPEAVPSGKNYLRFTPDPSK